MNFPDSRSHPSRSGERERAETSPLAHARGYNSGWAELAATYLPRAREALAESIIPFWWRAIDEEHGGVFNCWNNAGTRLLSRDRFTWSQGRFIWLWSRLADVTARGLLPGDATRYVAHAEKTVRFLQKRVFLRDGRCAFLLSEEGDVKEAFPGAGPAPSIYADCFVVMGFAEFARVSGSRAVLDAAWALFALIERRIAAGDCPTHPYPIPAGYESHAVAMIFLNMTLVLHEACAALADTRLAAAREQRLAAAARIFDRFMRPGGRIAELRRIDGREDDTLLSRHVIPGHALEGLWMLLTVANETGNREWCGRAAEAVTYAMARGWDDAHGGLLHHVDCDGGAPKGSASGSAYETNVHATWDTKLWWVHSEAIYAALLSHRITGDPAARAWFERVWEYAFRVFPQPDRAVGEWIQIRDRLGNPLERVVALPVKDPYHIGRNLLQVLELLSTTSATTPKLRDM